MSKVSIDGDSWLIDGEPTYKGREFRGWKIEGLLLNSRMTNALFDDENPATRSLWSYPDTGEWDADRNTDEFIAALPRYRSYGLLAVTVNMQGGSPTGYYREAAFRTSMAERGIEVRDSDMWAGVPSSASQPWHNSTFASDGSLKPLFIERAERMIEACDRLGMVVILGLFYFGQDERLEDENAVLRAVDETVDWLLGKGYANVLIEIDNECNIKRYEHEILQPHRVDELIARAKSRYSKNDERLLVGTSYGGGRVPSAEVARVSDFIMMHGNGVTNPSRISEMVAETRALQGFTAKPILFTEDDHFDFDRPHNNFTAALSSYASWGYFDPGDGAGGVSSFGNYRDGYQNIPINWGINTERKRSFFNFVREVSGL